MEGPVSLGEPVGHRHPERQWLNRKSKAGALKPAYRSSHQGTRGGEGLIESTHPRDPPQTSGLGRADTVRDPYKDLHVFV